MPKKITVRVDEPIKLNCHSDNNVILSQVKWYHNGHLVHENLAQGIIIEKRPTLDEMHSTLIIRNALFNNAGTYVCKFGQLHERINLEIIGEKARSSGIFF